MKFRFSPFSELELKTEFAFATPRSCAPRRAIGFMPSPETCGRWAPRWKQPDPPAQALLLRATLKQSTHDFTGALADLDRLIVANPRDGQAVEVGERACEVVRALL